MLNNKRNINQNTAAKCLFAHNTAKTSHLKNRPIMHCEPLNECTSCMLMDCVPGDVLLKKSQYSSCKIIILPTNIAVNGCDHAVDIKSSRFMYRQKCSCSYKQDGIQMCLLPLLATTPTSLPTTQKHFDWAVKRILTLF